MNCPAILLCVVFALLPSVGGSQTVHYSTGDVVSPTEVARILQRSPAGKTKMRGIVLQGAAATTQEEVARKPTALSLPVQFAFGSADILPSARTQLDAVAEGIKLLPPEQSVLIEGHTDVRGSAAYNTLLSQRRAVSVRRYLTASGIEPSRLKATGKGSSAPIDPGNPYASENRRVEFSGT